MKVYGTVELSPDQQELIDKAYETGKDQLIKIIGSITKFGEHSSNEDGTEDILSKFKVKLIEEIIEQ